jgi:collagenase-like PrtC family protease
MLLSHVQSPEGVISVLQSGTDAVSFSLGAPQLSPQIMQDARAAVACCLPRGIKSFLYINNHPTDKELAEWAVCVGELAAHGLSGVMLRDAGVLRMVRQVCPELETHIAPAADILTIKLAKFWYTLGASMVWLPPHLSRERLAYILKNSPVACGVTVAGSQCFILPESCSLAAGNRGACSTECRSPYAVNDKPFDSPFKPRDFILSDMIDDFELMGAEHFCVFSQSPDWTIERTVEQTAEWHKIIGGDEPKLVNVKFSCLIQAGQPVKAAVQDEDGRIVRVSGPKPSRSNERVIEAAVNTQFYKLAGTFYRCVQAKTRVEGSLTVPMSVIADLRKSVLELLTRERSKPQKRLIGAFHAGARYLTRPECPKITVWVRSMQQLSARLAALEPALLYVPLMELNSETGRLLKFIERGISVCAWLPRGLGDDEQSELHAALGQARSMGIKEISAPCLGYLDVLKKSGFETRLDVGAAVCNTQTLKEFRRLGIKSALLSHELTMAAVREMSHVIDTELQAYGRQPMGLSEDCIMKSPKGICGCDNKNELVDASGALAPLLREYKCRTGIYSPGKMFWGDRIDELNGLGLWALRLSFLTENAIECASVTERYMGDGTYAPGEFTRGML